MPLYWFKNIYYYILNIFNFKCSFSEVGRALGCVGRSGFWSWFCVTLRKPHSLFGSPILLLFKLVTVICKVVPKSGFHV